MKPDASDVPAMNREETEWKVFNDCNRDGIEAWS